MDAQPLREVSPAPPLSQRFPTIDALRGLALLGMLVVHFHDWAQDRGPAFAQIKWAVEIFAVDKFYPLFALLFGVSFAIQFQRWGPRADFLWIYLRRLLWLLAFSVVLIGATGYHVLEIYAIWGIVLLAIRKWSNRSLLLLVFAWILVAPARHFAIAASEQRQGVTTDQSNARVMEEWSIWPRYNREQDRLAETHQTVALVKLRLTHNFGEFTRVTGLIGSSDAFFMFLIGLYAIRKGILQDPKRHQDALIIMIVIGAIVTIFGSDLLHLPPLKMERLRVQAAYMTLLYRMLNEQFLGLAYASALALLIVHTAAGRRVGRTLAIVGRMSLTTYVSQILVLEVLLSPYGFNVQISQLTGLGLAVVVFAVQIVVSHWWLRRFRYGPLEWLWRSATFAEWQPLRA